MDKKLYLQTIIALYLGYLGIVALVFFGVRVHFVFVIATVLSFALPIVIFYNETVFLKSTLINVLNSIFGLLFILRFVLIILYLPRDIFYATPFLLVGTLLAGNILRKNRNVIHYVLILHMLFQSGIRATGLLDRSQLVIVEMVLVPVILILAVMSLQKISHKEEPTEEPLDMFPNNPDPLK